MLPGKKYTPEDILRILRRRFWIILVPLAIAAAATALVVRRLPNLYRAEAAILVVPQRVPDSYVRSTVTTRIEDRLPGISQQILSRARLERLIQDFDLYPEERRNGIMEDIVDKMRRDVDVRVVRGDAFRISYVGRDPTSVLRVTERLASMFIEESLRDRSVLAEGTSQFLEAQLEDARRRLVESEKKVEAYRRQYSGQLPTQLDANLQVIHNTQMQIQAILESLNRDRDERLELSRQLADLEAEAAESTDSPTVATAAPPGADGVPEPVGSAAQQLAAARTALEQMQLRLKPEHPDIQRLKRTIRELEKKADTEALQAPVSVPSRAQQARQRRMNELRERLQQLDRQIENKQNQEKQLRSVTGSYQQRVDAIPTRESEMIELTRDYTTLQSMYTNLLAKKEESKMAANLERRQVGEQFKLLDPARLPQKPFSPDRQRMTLLGGMGGAMFGLALIAFLEYRDTTLKTDDDVAKVLSLPVLAVIPHMESDADRRAATRKRWALGLGLGSIVAGSLAIVAYTLVR